MEGVYAPQAQFLSYEISTNVSLYFIGYYDGVIFHRVVPNFLVQTGDRTGTGGGGESFYGDAFEDEIHPRLKFPHRGIVAMANNGDKNSNDSQFFITLGEFTHGAVQVSCVSKSHLTIPPYVSRPSGRTLRQAYRVRASSR